MLKIYNAHPVYDHTRQDMSSQLLGGGIAPTVKLLGGGHMPPCPPEVYAYATVVT